MSTPTAYVIRRNHTIAEFDSNKIYTAIMKAFLAVEGDHANDSSRIHDTVTRLTVAITDNLFIAAKASVITHNNLPLFAIEDIQNHVERQLMHSDYYTVAKAYILYREARHQERQDQPTSRSLPIILHTGEHAIWTEQDLHSKFDSLAADLNDVDADWLHEHTLATTFEWITEKELYTAIIMLARSRIEVEPQYSYVAARVLLLLLQQEAVERVVSIEAASFFTSLPTAALHYTAYFRAYIKQAVEKQLLHPRMLEVYGSELTRLGDALNPKRDLSFTYLGLQTLYDRYFIHDGDTRIELPQAFFMRVAMGLSLNEQEPVERAIEFYHLLSQFDYMTSTPTLFNSGTLRPQLSSCFLSTVPDDLDSIYEAIKDNALLSKYAGGLGNDWTSVRALGSHIVGTNGKSQGVVPFLKVVNDSAIAVNQGGKRLGAACVYLESWHLDIEEFLELKKNTGDERRRTHDINTANWIPDLLMQRVMEEGMWTLFSPSDVPDLHDLYGAAFKARYEEYEALAESGQLHHKRLPALQLWRKMLTMLYETGHPWITFKDPCNIRYTNQHVGVVHSSNLCTEICLHTNAEEIRSLQLRFSQSSTSYT
jgi:ribonucleoside-diphosphate reductase alpha chain